MNFLKIVLVAVLLNPSNYAAADNFTIGSNEGGSVTIPTFGGLTINGKSHHSKPAKKTVSVRQAEGQMLAEIAGLYYVVAKKGEAGLPYIKKYFNKHEHPEGYEKVVKHLDSLRFEQIRQKANQFKTSEDILEMIRMEDLKKAEQPKKERFSNLMTVFGQCMANTPMEEWEEKIHWWKKEIYLTKKAMSEKGDITIHGANYLRSECGLSEIKRIEDL